MPADLKEIQLKTQLIHKGNYLEFYRDQVRLPNGATAFREYLHHPGAVAAVPLLQDGRVVLVRQYRYATGGIRLEIPAGKLEPGEEPEAAIRRELTEEIGYQAGEMIHLISMWTTPGFTDEIIHLYAARDLTPCSGEADSDEFLEIVTYEKAELLQLIHSGEVMDGKTALALLTLDARGLW